MSKIVTYKMDLNKPPVLSEEQKARLEALAKRPDSEIDFSDIPELDDSFWGKMQCKIHFTSRLNK